MAGDTEAVPLELAERFGLTGRDAATLVNLARGGSRRIRDHLLGEPDNLQVVWTSESHNPQ